MNKLIAALLLGTALVSPALAREVTITTSMIRYSGNAAYVAVYLTEPDGRYNSTLWISGTRQRYFGELRGWIQAVQASGATSLSIDGITGASIGGGQTLTVHADLADAMIDAGYKIHVVTAVEHGGQFADDAVAPVSATPQTVDGVGYVSKLTVSM